MPGILAIATGCSQKIQVREADAVIPAGRIRIQAVPSTQPVRDFNFSGLVVEGEIAHSAINDNQPVPVGRTVFLDRIPFVGPTVVRNRARVLDANITARSGFSVRDIFRFEPIFGVQTIYVDLETSSGGVQASDRSASYGPVFGARAGIQPHEMIEFYGQFTWSYLFGGRHRVEGIFGRRGEGGVRLLLDEHIGFFAGYRWSKLIQQRDPDESNAEIELGGAILGLELRF